MFDLFRFFMLRPPELIDNRDTILVTKESKLYTQLKQAKDENEPLTVMRGVAKDFVQGEEFVAKPTSVYHADSLKELHTALLGKPNAQLSDLKRLVQNAFDQAADEVAGSEAFHSDKTRVHESLLAVKLASSTVQTNLDHLSLYGRLIHLVERIADDDPTLNDAGAVSRALARLLILPAELFPLPSPLEQRHTKTTIAPHATIDNKADVEAATKRAAVIESTLTALTNIAPEDFSRPVVTPPIQTASPVVGKVVESQRPGFFARLLGVDVPTSTRLESTTDAALGQVSDVTRFTLKSEAVAQLHPESQAVLRELKLDLTATPAPTAIRILGTELSRIQQSLTKQISGSKNITGFEQLRFGGINVPAFASNAIVPLPPPLPKIHGHIKPVGIADLLVVKYQLLRYERGEVAYIENILKGESSERSVRRLETTEETTVLETETTKEEERDLQSTERFELQNETENTVTAEGNLKSGNAFSPSYGPMLEFHGGTESPISGSQSQSSRQASNYSREVTSRSASKVTERVRKQVTLRRLREFEENTRHSFNNADTGAANVSGVFQWVEKVLQGQVFSYGKRLMFDIMVPEPAAFVQQVIAGNSPAGQGLKRPPEFTLSPAAINESNYLSLVQQYGADRVSPAPAFSLTVSKSYKAIIPPNSSRYLEADMLNIPPGYVAASAYVVLSNFVIRQPTGRIEVIVGEQWLRWFADETLNQSRALNSETTNIAVSLMSSYLDLFNINIEITCIRTGQTYQAWQLQTHAAILQAYNARLSEYEEQLANRQASARIEALGKNPEENRKLIKEELKKSCISVFTYQHFDIFGGLEASLQGHLQIKLTEAESQGEFIRFFEQAFEWEQMIYLFYPYFWGNKNYWRSKLSLEEFDPLFKDFLKAGETRVTIPVRPGFEKSVAHYLETGEIWNGGDPLDITSGTYLPILKEIQERDAISGTEVPYGDPWEVRLPTTLVSLRVDGKLPRWKEEPKGSGQWVEEDGA